MITRYAIRNAMIDALEQACDDTQSYYVLNHLSPQQLCELEDLMVKWLRSVGIKFEV
jgi:hypothetical protein